MLVKSPVANYEVDHTVAARQAIEKHIARLFIRAAMNAGYVISVWDGEAYPLSKSNSETAILKAMFSTDEDTLVVYRRENGPEFSLAVYGKVGAAQFIYGNDGYDVLADYSTSLEPLMATITAYQTKHGY